MFLPNVTTTLVTTTLAKMNIVSVSNWSSNIRMIGQFFFLIIVFIGVLYLSYLSTKFVAKAKLNGSKGKNMKVIETVYIGNQASIQLVKVGKQYFIISLSKDNVTFLSEVKPDGIIEDETGITEPSVPFENYLKEYIGKFIKNKNEK